MDPFLLIEWVGEVPVLALPATVGLAWRLEELAPELDDPDGSRSEREVYERGWRLCECYSTREPHGERGYLPAANLVPLRADEFDVARMVLRRRPEVFERNVAGAFEDAITRWD